MGTTTKATGAARCLLAIWALVAADLWGAAFARALDVAVGREQREFDYFALSLQWPGTICPSTRHCCAVNGCCRSEPLQTFTIHGLWPDYDDGTWPSCCRHTNFDMDKILPLKPTLDKYWPSLYCSSSSTCFSGKGPFWAHEVSIFSEKHGTCSSPVVKDELEYFSTTLDLYFKYNVMEMLTNGGIHISNVEELRLCFNKDLKPRDCLTTTASNENVSKKNSCPRYITLPTYDPLVLVNSTREIITQVESEDGTYEATGAVVSTEIS
ncbi:hypothetical protein GUJ93_ZPchr0069g33258 [Zizania palustris]|uniref:Uncharacterized protein n=1 Tax=Zizania palustris TaxID=103762 RepID=A0A8J5REI0_ZIZPA|nr:hypothetical protein GUJ93_ZPchr0069g33258 [Zizania palustris]